MRNYRQTINQIISLITFCFVVGLINLPLTITSTADVQVAEVDGIAEIVVVGTDGYVYAYDYTGEQIYISPEGGWSYVTTADFNGDGDHEIVAAGDNKIKIYDPQIEGDEYTFEATYTNISGSIKKVAIGNLRTNTAVPDIALLIDVDSSSKGRVVVYEPPTTQPVIDVEFLTDWRDFAIGDYDGDGDDDFALIYWTSDQDLNLLEMRKGNEPEKFLQSADDTGSVVSSSEWFDIAPGNFVSDNGSRIEWVGAQNIGDNIVVQKWDNKKVKTEWAIQTPFNYVAAADFRNQGNDQVVMLRSISSGVSLQFATTKDNGDVSIWSKQSGLGTGWLNLAAANLDDEATYDEAVVIKQDLIRVYLQPQSPSEYIDCFPHDAQYPNECLDIDGSFNGSIAVGDLGVNIILIPPTPPAIPFKISEELLSNVVAQSQTLLSSRFEIYGEITATIPVKWQAIIFPDFTQARTFENLVTQNEDLDISMTQNRLSYQGDTGSGTLPIVPWITLSAYSGTATSTVTAYFSDTYITSPLHNPGAYRAIIFIWRTNSQTDRFRYLNVYVLNKAHEVYLPVVLK